MLIHGRWNLYLQREDNYAGEVTIPGSLQEQGYGEEISRETAFVSGLHDPLWYLREEYQYGQENGVKVPFLSQPKKHFIGKAYYRRTVEIEKADTYFLFIEIVRQKTRVWVDGERKTEMFSLCCPHVHELGRLTAGCHELMVEVDNSMIHPYRPDGHMVNDGVGATFNGMIGEVSLLTGTQMEQRRQQRLLYAKAHPRTMAVKDGEFIVDGKLEFLRGTHYAGENLQTGYPAADLEWWQAFFQRIKAWGLNFVRFHSFCPPRAAFLAADQADMLLQVEAGMWNVFNPDIAMLDVLREETERILANFGHHPSFALFAPSNEPGGQWHEPLRRWVGYAKAVDARLGYAGRRIYTSEAGWPHQVPPKEVTGMDYLYFHNSRFGPFEGRVRGKWGWKGKDYRTSVEGTALPVISHELGQWTSYPDFEVIEAYGSSFLTPSPYQVYRAHAKAKGLLPLNKKMAYCSAKLQAMLYKEDIEAQYRTPGIGGYELLDLHDYIGQGTACVGILDPLFREKGGISKAEWRQFCQPKMVLARFPGYVFTNTQKVKVPVERCDYQSDGPRGKNIPVEEVILDFEQITVSQEKEFVCRYEDVINTYRYTVFVRHPLPEAENVVYTRVFETAREALLQGKKVIYSPNLSDLDYNCPPLSFPTVFWNAQMGPQWSRGMGMICDTAHPIFRHFPTSEYGGWQWEDIFDHGRALNLLDAGISHEPVVRIIDEPNRSHSLGLIVEGRAGAGRLLMVTADLEGEFEQRPAAYALKESLLRYAASEEFCPAQEIDLEKIKAMLLPNHSPYFYENGNPNSIKTITQKALPAELSIPAGGSVKVYGLVYLANQKDRMHIGDIKTMEVYADRQRIGCFSLKSTVCQQKIYFEQAVTADTIRLVITQTYQKAGVLRWEMTSDGWHSYQDQENGVVSFSILGLITDTKVKGNNEAYWNSPAKPATKEIFL